MTKNFRALLDSVPDAMVIIDSTGTIVLANRQVETLLGYSEAELVGQPVEVLLPESARAGHPVQVAAYLERPEARRMGADRELYGLRKDGSVVPVEIRLSTIRTEDRLFACAAIRDISERKANEAARRDAEAARWRSDQDYASLLEQASDAILIADAEWRWILVNNSACELLGYTRAELLRLRVEEIIAPEDLAARPLRTEALQGHRVVRGERLLVRRDGSRVPTEVSSRLLPDGRFQAIVRDITERKEAEAALRASEERYRALIDNASDLIYSHDLRGHLLAINRAGEELTGYSRSELLNMQLSQVVAPEYREVLRERGESRLRRGDTSRATCELELVARGGQRVPVEVSTTPVVEGGKIVALQGIARDTTERRSAEAALRASEARFRAICEASPIGIFLSDLQGGCVYANPALVSQLGVPEPDVLGCGWINALHPEDREPMIQAWSAAIRERRGFELTVRVPRSDGTVTQLVVRVAPVWQECELLGFVGSSVDVTERASLEAQLRQAQKMEAVGRLAGGVAHDFNNMLAVINGYSDMARSQLSPGDPLHGLLSEVAKAGERAATLTRQLLTFSRKQLLEPEQIDLSRVVLELQPMLGRLIGEDILLEAVAESGEVWVNADPGQLEQVILNLAVNARDAMPRGGRLRLRTRRLSWPGSSARTHPGLEPGVYSVLEVSDTGCGMTPEVQARIFEPFFTTKGPGQGTGLGLATVYGIVTQSGGRVEVESTPGAGSTFRVYLPTPAATETAADEAPAEREVPRGAETILLVEDEEMVRTLIRTVLEGCGYRVLEASTPEELQQVREELQSLDLLITDVVMPRLSGPEVAEQLRQQFPELKVLYMSGYTNDAVLRHGIHTAEVAFIQKPFSPLALAQKVRELLN